jgi:hypothetical protein
MGTMFFAILCILLLGLMLSGHPPDPYGWMMLMGVAWFCGYLDCRRFGKSDQESARVMPLDSLDQSPPDDKTLFRT